MKATLIVMGESYYGIESTGWVCHNGRVIGHGLTREAAEAIVRLHAGVPLPASGGEGEQDRG